MPTGEGMPLRRAVCSERSPMLARQSRAVGAQRDGYAFREGRDDSNARKEIRDACPSAAQNPTWYRRALLGTRENART